MENKILLVAKREYIKIVKKPSFWILLFIIPILYVALMAIMGVSTKSVEEKIVQEAKEAKQILIIDETGLIRGDLINDDIITAGFTRADNKKDAIALVRSGEADALFVYPEDIAQSQEIKLFAKETSLLSRSRFDNMAHWLLNQSLLQEIGDDEKVALFNADLTLTKTLYKDGDEVDQRFEVFIIPIVSILVYFLLTFLSASYMLSSVTEEKENRMIETVLSTISPRELIWGKIIGLTGVAFTQLIALGALGGIAVLVSQNVFTIAIDWSAVNTNVWQILSAFFYIITGFLFLSSIMVGLGAAMPRYRDAQQLSGIFILLAVVPIYFAQILIADPGGTIARIASFTPFTAPLILLFRGSLDALPLWESIVGMIVMAAYVGIGFFVAFKLFELGSLELSKKISVASIFQKQKK
jgi:ABC-2 type transport system permease protein